MKIGIVGSRSRNTEQDFNKVLEALTKVFRPGDTFVSGKASKGADMFAHKISVFFNIPITEHEPKYHIHGRAAPHVRNEIIARESDVLIACVSADRKGGTESTIKKFKRHHPEGRIVYC